MSQKIPDVDALENAASVIQREEQKAVGTNPPGGAGSKAKSLADQTANELNEPYTSSKTKHVDPKAADEAARTIQREETKIYGGEIPAGGAAATAQSFAARAAR